MCPIPNAYGSDDFSPSSWEDGDSSEAFTGKLQFKDLIKKANLVSIVDIFKFYGLKVSDVNRKVVCPFVHHKGGGKEQTPSFLYYPSTNTFFCFGCSTGSKPVDFVSIIDGISKIQAANKIINLYGEDQCEDDFDVNTPDFSEKLKIILEFSNYIRELMSSSINDKDFIIFLEKNTLSFDTANDKYSLDNEALLFLINNIKKRIERYLCQH